MRSITNSKVLCVVFAKSYIDYGWWWVLIDGGNRWWAHRGWWWTLMAKIGGRIDVWKWCNSKCFWLMAKVTAELENRSLLCFARVKKSVHIEVSVKVRPLAELILIWLWNNFQVKFAELCLHQLYSDKIRRVSRYGARRNEWREQQS